MDSKKTALIVTAMLFGSIATFVMFMLAGLIYPYGSTEFGNWAMWLGAIFGGIASVGALAAAYFTRNTIRFLTGQHKEQQKLQKIHQYQSHKKALYEVFDEVLKENTYSFLSKFKLYRSIFPDNSISSTKLTASIENCSLVKAVETWNELIDYFKKANNLDFNVSNFENNFVEKYVSLYQDLHLKRTDDRFFGDVYHRNVGFTEPKKIFNIISAHTDLFDIYNFLSSLVEFSGLKDELALESPSGQTPTLFLRYYLDCPNNSYVIEKELDALSAFEICARYLCYLSVNNNSELNACIINHCMIYTTQPHKTIEFLNNKSAQEGILRSIKAECIQHINGTIHNGEFRNNAQLLMEKIDSVIQAK